MAYEHKENRGSLFRNERKEQDTHADYNGEINVEGKVFYLNAWLNETDSGKKYFSLSVKEKQARGSEGVAEAKQAAEDFQDDSIPF